MAFSWSFWLAPDVLLQTPSDVSSSPVKVTITEVLRISRDLGYFVCDSHCPSYDEEFAPVEWRKWSSGGNGFVVADDRLVANFHTVVKDYMNAIPNGFRFLDEAHKRIPGKTFRGEVIALSGHHGEDCCLVLTGASDFSVQNQWEFDDTPLFVGETFILIGYASREDAERNIVSFTRVKVNRTFDNNEVFACPCKFYVCQLNLSNGNYEFKRGVKLLRGSSGMIGLKIDRQKNRLLFKIIMIGYCAPSDECFFGVLRSLAPQDDQLRPISDIMIQRTPMKPISTSWKITRETCFYAGFSFQGAKIDDSQYEKVPRTGVLTMTRSQIFQELKQDEERMEQMYRDNEWYQGRTELKSDGTTDKFISQFNRSWLSWGLTICVAVGVGFYFGQQWGKSKPAKEN